MNKRIVIASFGSFGDVFPYVGLALGLRDRGHDPVLAMPPYYREVVEREDLEFRPLRPDVDPADRGMIGRIMHPRSGTEFLVREVIVPALRESYSDLIHATRGADLLVSHPVTFAGPLIGAAHAVPWISSVLAPMSFFSRYDPPVVAPMPWLEPLSGAPGVARALIALSRRITRNWTAPVADLRRELGLMPGGNPLFEGQHSPAGVLALFSRVLAEPQPDWPPNVSLTGAIPYNGPQADRLPPDLARFLDDGPPPVVFTLGSSAVGAAGRFYDESLGAVEKLGTRAVMLVGSHAANRPRVPLPASVLLAEFASHAALFPRASAVVHQGGVGTLHQALRAGHPTLVVPHAHDQPDNAARVERLGVSRTLAPRRYRAERVARELDLLLGDSTYRRRAAGIGERVRAEDGVSAACDAIERIIAPVPP